MNKYNNRVRELRAKYRMSQESLAAKVNTTRQTISAIENGRKPSLDIALKISEVFGLPVNNIFFTNTVTQELQNNSTA